MKKDFNVFLKNPEYINRSEFELFAFNNGFQIRMYPSDNYLEHTGFLPFNLRLNFIDRFLPFDSYLSGFEAYFWQYNECDYGTDLSDILSDTKKVMLISASDMDSLEELCALVFAKYLCEKCGGVLYDAQRDVFVSESSDIDSLIDRQKSLLIDLANNDTLLLHEFRQWL